MDAKALIKSTLKENQLSKELLYNLEQFLDNYLLAREDAACCEEEYIPLLRAYIELVEKNSKNPFIFPSYHKPVRAPFDHKQLVKDFWSPLVNRSSSIFLGKENAQKIAAYLENKENVIFLSNHQSEADPQVLDAHLEGEFPNIANETLYIAGHRVTTDPISIPFGMGMRLLCIFSKKRINHPPHLREHKIQHNRQTMQVLRSLLEEGGHAIYVAPSGGRDRPDENGYIDVGAFDPSSIEMFRLMALQAKTPTHYFPLSLYSYELLPPPLCVHNALGEERVPSYTPVHLYIGQELDFASVPKEIEGKRKEERHYRCALAHKAVKSNYDTLLEAAKNSFAT